MPLNIPVATPTTLSNTGAGEDLVGALVGANYPISTLFAGDNITLTPQMDGSLQIEATGGGSSTTLSNAGAGSPLVGTLVGNNYPISSLVAGSNITLTPLTGSVTIASTTFGFGDVTGAASSVGGRLVTYASTTGKSLNNASTISATGNTLTGSGSPMVVGNASSSLTFNTTNITPNTDLNLDAYNIINLATLIGTVGFDLVVQAAGSAQNVAIPALRTQGRVLVQIKPVVDADYSVTSNDYLIAYRSSLSATRTVTLPATVDTGFISIIKDETGSASAIQSIDVVAAGGAVIDGSSTYSITTAYGVARFYFNGSNWFTW